MDDAIRFFRGEFTKGNFCFYVSLAALQIYLMWKNSYKGYIFLNGHYNISMHIILQPILLLTSSIKNTPIIFVTTTVKKEKKLIGHRGIV